MGATVSGRDDGAVVIDNILEESEAYRRGLRADDELVSFAGRSIRSVNQFKNILGIYPKGWKLPLVYRRDGEKFTIYPRLRALHKKSEFTKKKPEPPKPMPRPMPKPGDPPKGKPGDPPKLPIPQIGRRPKPKLPDKYKHMLVKKEAVGSVAFANYYFNKLEQDRTLATIKDLGDFSKAQGRMDAHGKNRQRRSLHRQDQRTGRRVQAGR